MTSPLNGASLSPIGDWVIAITNGKDFIGKPVYAGRPIRAVGGRVVGQAADPVRIERLSPVFELQIKLEVMQVMDARTRQPARDAQGNPIIQQRTNYGGVPVCLLASVREVELPDGAIIIEVASLSPEDRKRMAACVAMAEQMAQNMRAADSNLTLVPALPQGLPKPPGQQP
jgi:hypothetical protein